MNTLFLSDLHLGAKYVNDKRAHEKAICDFLLGCYKEVNHIYLLGDILDYWYEYRHVVPRGFVRFLGTIAFLSDNGVKITWLTGNHDIWLFDYLSNELNIEVVDSPYIERTINGKRFILAHGDRIGHQTPGFKLICSLFRNKFCQTLYSAIHPRWTIPFAYTWSKSSRNSHCQNNITDNTDTINKITHEAEDFLKKFSKVDYMIMGHHHIMLNEMLTNPKCQLVVLGECFSQFTYASFNGETLVIDSFKNLFDNK